MSDFIVTAGPTYEPLDQVRRLINFSTGRLGSELADYLAKQGHRVTLLLGQQATWRSQAAAHFDTVTFSTTADLHARLQSLSTTSVDALFHAAAVSDFSFGKVWSRGPGGELTEIKRGKYSTRDGTLVAELVPTRKVIASLRDWSSTSFVYSW